jgi:NADH dehydrogenase
MILVAGATGFLGTEICRLLRERGEGVRALVRRTSDKAKLDRLRSFGIELVHGDLKDPPSLEEACAGIDTVISTASCTISRQPDDTIQRVDHDGQLALVDAAVDQGVDRYLFVSVSGNLTVDSPLLTAKRTVEEAIRESGMTYTIVRPSFFVEIWLSPAFGFDVANSQARIFGSGDQRMSWISLQDVARFTVACVDHPAAQNAIFELGGEALSPNEIIRVVEQRTGKPMSVERIPEAALRQQAADARNDPMGHTIAALCLSYAAGDVVEMGKAREIDVPIRSARELVAR